MYFEFVKTDGVVVSSGLHPKKQSKAKDAHRIGRDILHGDEPGVLFHQVQVLVGQVNFDIVVISMYSTDDSDVLEVDQSIFQGVVEGGAGILPNELGKASAVNYENSGVHMSIQDVPTDAKEGLISDQANGILTQILDRMGQFDLEHSGDHTPSVCVDIIGGSSQHATRMSDLMACLAQSDTFKHVVFMVADDVLEDFFWFAIELPQVQDDMVEVNQMVAFKVFDTTAFKTGSSSVSAHPVRVGKGGSDSLVEVLPSRCVVHASLYTQNRTWTDKKWDLDSQSAFWGHSCKELGQKNMYGIRRTITAGKPDCNSIIGAYIRPTLEAI